MLCNFSALRVNPLQPTPTQKLHRHRLAALKRSDLRAVCGYRSAYRYGAVQTPMRGYQYNTRRLLNTLAEQSKLILKLPETV